MDTTDHAATPDKTGTALNEQRFHMLQDIARDLKGDVVFPTTFDLVVRLRRVLQDPNASIDQIAGFVVVEPLISARLIGLANSVAFASTGKVTTSVRGAVMRLGINNVRSCAMAIAVGQLLRAKEMAAFDKLAQGLWQHSLRAASACYVVARDLSRINPDEAMLAGMVHDLGAFYMLFRASQYDELRERPDTVRHLIMQWHESIGHALLIALGIPEAIAEAVREHEQPRQLPAQPRSLADVVYAGNLLAGGIFENDDGTVPTEEVPLGEEYLELREAIEAHQRELGAVFA